MLAIFLDTETNGLNAHKHRVIEIAFQIVDVYTGALKDSFDSVVSISKEDWDKSDPSSLQVNGFVWEDTLPGKPQVQVAEQIRTSFAKNGIKRGTAVFICQNPSFDRAFFSQLINADEQEALSWPYHWLDLASMYWAQSIKTSSGGLGKYPWETGLSKDKIAQTYRLPKENKPHRAMNGVKHLLLCYEAVVGFPEK